MVDDGTEGGRHPELSVCIVTGRRIPQLDACLLSLLGQVDAPDFELLVCSDGDPDVIGAVHRRFPSARVCAVRAALPGAARNLLVEQARGDLLVFLDDDITADRHLLARYADLARRHPEVGVFGGPNATPLDSSDFQVVQGEVLASPAGSGPVRRRYRAQPASAVGEEGLILCNLAVRRVLMVPFAGDLVCAEENEMLAELRSAGVAMRYDPDLVVHHERRPTLGGFARQMHKYGRGRGQVLRRRPSATRAGHLAPPALVAYAAASPVTARVFGPVALAPLAAYAVAVTVGAASVARSVGRARVAPLAAGLLVVLHTCYGTGVLRGFLQRRRHVASPRALSWTGPMPHGAGRRES